MNRDEMPTSDGSTENETQSSQTRFWLTNDFLATLLVLSLIGLIMAGSGNIIDLTVVPQNIRSVYLSIVILSSTWAFGESAYRIWNKK